MGREMTPSCVCSSANPGTYVDSLEIRIANFHPEFPPHAKIEIECLLFGVDTDQRQRRAENRRPGQDERGDRVIAVEVGREADNSNETTPSQK